MLVWALHLHPATPGWGARRGCVCFGSGFGCTPPLLTGVLGCVCAGVGAPLAPRHSWLGFAPWVCVFGLGFWLRPATPGWGVALCVCWCERSAAARHSWLGCVPWVCVFGLGFWLHPATPGWGVGLCVCWCGRSACTPPLLAGVRAVGVCVWARNLAAPRHSWLGCWVVCVLVWALRLHPATPGWGARRGCVCLGSGISCAPPLLAGVLGCVCAGLRASPVPSLSPLGCAAWVCVLGLGFRLRPATPGPGVGLCVCSCARSACNLPLLAGVRGVCVCVWAQVSGAPHHSWLGCALWVCVLGLGFWLRPATPGWGLWCLGWLLPGTCSCAVVRCVLCALSRFVAPGDRCCLAPVGVPLLWPVACLSGVPRGPAWCAAPRLVRLLSVLRSAFPSPWCLSPPRGLAPPALLGGCAGYAEAGREPGSLCLPLAPAEAGALGSLRVVPVRSPAMRLSLAGHSGVGLGLRALRWLACVDPVTDASGFPDCSSFDGGLGRCTGAVSCGCLHRLLRVGGRHTRVPCVCACACSSWPGRAGRPPGCVLVRLTFSFGCFGFLLCFAPSGLGLPPSWSFFSFSVAVLRASPLSPAFFGFRPRVPWALALCVVCLVGLAPLCPPCALAPFVLPAWLLFVAWWLPPPPSFCVLRFFLPPLRSLCFFFLVCAPVVYCFLWFPAPGALGLGAVLCVFFSSRLSALRALSLFVFLLGRWLLLGAWHPPPSFVSGWFRRCRSVPLPPPFFFVSLCAPPLSLAFSGFRPRVPWALALCFVCFVCLPLLGSPCALSFFCVSPGRWLLPGGCCPPPPLPLGAPFFFFFALCAPVVSGFLWFPALAALGLGAARCLLCWPPASRLPVHSRLFRASRLAVGCSPVVAAPPPPFCVSRFLSCRSCVPCVVLCCVSRLAVLRCAAARCVARCCAVVCCVVLLRWVGAAARRAVPPGAPRCPGSLCFAALCFAVFPRAVCVLSLRGGVCCCSPLCFVLCVSWGAVLCVPCPLRSVRCCASLCWCACVVLFVWCVLLLAPGAVVHCRVLCCFLWCAVVRCWVWL